MNTSEEDVERIHSYLLDELSPEARRAFEESCAQNPQLAEALALEKRVVAIIRQNAQLEIEDQVARAAARAKRRRRTRGMVLFGAISAAAAVVLLIVVNLFLEGGGDYYSLPPRDLLLDEYKSETQQDNPLMVQAVAQFDRGALDSALQTLDQLPDTGEVALRGKFLEGHCEFRRDSLSNAIAVFKSVREEAPEDSKMLRYAWWYLVVAYHRSGDLGNAKSELKALKSKEYAGMSDDLKMRVDELGEVLGE